MHLYDDNLPTQKTKFYYFWCLTIIKGHKYTWHPKPYKKDGKAPCLPVAPPQEHSLHHPDSETGMLALFFGGGPPKKGLEGRSCGFLQNTSSGTSFGAACMTLGHAYPDRGPPRLTVFLLPSSLKMSASCGGGRACCRTLIHPDARGGEFLFKIMHRESRHYLYQASFVN